MTLVTFDNDGDETLVTRTPIPLFFSAEESKLGPPSLPHKQGRMRKCEKR